MLPLENNLLRKNIIFIIYFIAKHLLEFICKAVVKNCIYFKAVIKQWKDVRPLEYTFMNDTLRLLLDSMFQFS